MTRDDSVASSRGWYGRGYHPHCDYPGLVQAIGFRLFDSVPAQLIESWERELVHLSDSPKRIQLNERIERYADAGYGSCLLANPHVATVAVAAFLHFDNERYDLLSWCVMPNHVHVLVAARTGNSISKIVHSWKSFIAHEANKTLGRTGQFWLQDYFDQFMKSTVQMSSTIEYIESNPVNAGLASEPSQWPFSSASAEFQSRAKENRLRYPEIDPDSLPDFKQ